LKILTSHAPFFLEALAWRGVTPVGVAVRSCCGNAVWISIADTGIGIAITFAGKEKSATKVGGGGGGGGGLEFAEAIVSS